MTVRLSVSLHAVSLRRGDQWVLRDITLRLQAGDRWALIGENGAGKTQLLKLLGGDVWPTPTGREARLYRMGALEIELPEAKRRMAYVGAELQDKYARYGWNPRIFDLLTTGLHRTDLLYRPATREENVRVDAMLARCGLTRLKERAFHSLSYGEKRLALLARALIQDPDWLLLDEFYNGLDAAYRRRLDAILARFGGDGQAWIASAHRAVDVPRGTFGLIELRAGRLHEVKRLRAGDMTRMATQAQERRPRSDAGLATFRPARLPATPARPGRGKTLLRLTRVHLYVDYRPVLRDVNWELHAGQHWAVFGANGAGKSSFLKLLHGDLSPALGGTIERSGFPRGTPIEAWKRRVGHVSPELQTAYDVDVSVLELVASGRYASIGLAVAPTPADKRHAQRWLKFFALSPLAKRRPRELSYGQLRRALIARALAANPFMLLLDEPLTGLDPGQRAVMKHMLERLMKKRVTLIIAVHHALDLPRGITHALRLHRRRASALDSHSAT